LGLIGEISTSIPVAHSTNITHNSIQQCLLFRKTWVSWQIPEMMGWQWHQLDNTPIICIFNIIIHYRQLISYKPDALLAANEKCQMASPGKRQCANCISALRTVF